ncbi:hypothetical protein BS47DRAFT_1348549 [Hydnum rufescens UP504]|uniref:Uncharacterized protein n=1 Tax=Hydnum rufescens UP504 TaxID=1448309 RepID=A0A9P6DTW1_9AGAM|nr:hypothetical protein BS47DRAFT_1348549 [Hydnum rufescens UP504]
MPVTSRLFRSPPKLSSTTEPRVLRRRPACYRAHCPDSRSRTRSHRRELGRQAHHAPYRRVGWNSPGTSPSSADDGAVRPMRPSVPGTAPLGARRALAVAIALHPALVAYSFKLYRPSQLLPFPHSQMLGINYSAVCGST